MHKIPHLASLLDRRSWKSWKESCRAPITTAAWGLACRICPGSRGVPGRTDATVAPLSLHTREESASNSSSASSRTSCMGEERKVMNSHTHMQADDYLLQATTSCCLQRETPLFLKWVWCALTTSGSSMHAPCVEIQRFIITSE